MTPQQLKHSEIILKANPEYANAVEDEVNEPKTYAEASQNLAWQKAKEKEIIVEQNQTWELVPRPRDTKLISCKWAYEIMCTPDGSIVRYKAQTLDSGFSQEYGLDYDETFSPATKIIIVQVPPVLTINKDWKLWQMDMNNAFLHGELN